MASTRETMQQDIARMASRMTDKELAMLYSLARAIDTRQKGTTDK